MSLESWKNEFYEEKFVKERAAQQSLKKWKGLLPENLAKHGVKYDPTFKVVRDNIEFMRINDSTCSLCYFYYRVNPDAPSCVECPLYTVNGSVKCDKQNCSGINLYVENNPIHMIEALERAVELEKTMFPQQEN